MASNSETGYAKNASNLDSLISSLAAAGTKYNPARADTGIPALKLLSVNTWIGVKGVNDNEKLENQAIANRQIQLGDYKKFATLIINALSGSGASKQKIAEATTINRRIQGIRASGKAKPALEGAEAPKTHSISQASYDGILENFKSLVGTLKTEPLYMPNEPEITIAAIDTYIVNLQNNNKAVNDATAATSVARTQRDAILFDAHVGLYDIVTAVKKYLRSVPALRDTYDAVVKLKFTGKIKK
jgi:hypothetical protein